MKIFALVVVLVCLCLTALAVSIPRIDTRELAVVKSLNGLESVSCDPGVLQDYEKRGNCP